VQFALYTKQDAKAVVATPVAATILAGDGRFSRGRRKEILVSRELPCIMLLYDHFRSTEISTMKLVRAVICVVGVMFTALWFSGARSAPGSEQQSRFHVYTVSSSGWGYAAAAFSPDDRLLAVIASKGFQGKEGTEITEEVQIWDFRSGKLIAEKVLSRRPLSTVTQQHPDQGAALYGYTHSGSELLLYRDGHLMLLDAATLDQIREIDLGMSSWPKFPPSWASRSFLEEVTMDGNGRRVAVLLQWGTGGGGELRVYNLNSGDLIRKWAYQDLRGKRDRSEDFGGADISPDGRQVAVSIIPFGFGEGELHASDRNVFVLDVDSGHTVASINTDYPAGEVRFAPVDPPSLLTVSADNFDRGRSRKDTIKVWDPQNGKLLSGLARPPEGVHFQLQVSSDGRIVMGYTGLERFTGHWWLLQEEYGFVAYNRFSLWDLKTGQIIASSPEIPPSQSHRQFLLSPKGDVVLLYPESAGGTTLTFYEFGPVPKTE
jgi:WD40 repeat protein